MILVTGGFGFIGSNIIRNLNKRGQTNILVVDDLTNGHKFKNLVDCEFDEYFDKDEFFAQAENLWDKIKYVYHEGAISSTTEWNGNKVMRDNYLFTDKILNKCMEFKIPLSYASSASVYGNTTHFSENGNMDPLNMYAYSKALFDKKISKLTSMEWYQNSPYVIQGWRYFNVYGNGEEHKENQASPIHKFIKQSKEKGYIEVFEGSENFVRDFICAEDIAILKIEMLQRNISGIFNAGTGKPISFMDVAKLVSQKTGAEIRTIPFPDELKGHYQNYTCANLDKLNSVGCPVRFRSVRDYMRNFK